MKHIYQNFQDKIFFTQFGGKIFFLRVSRQKDSRDRIIIYLEYLNNLCTEFDIIGVCETWLTCDNSDLYKMKGYDHVKQVRINRKGGGVSLFIRNNINFSERNDVFINETWCEADLIKMEKSQPISRKILLLVKYIDLQIPIWINLTTV